ncbi:hypothetical protein PENTCL1PPCAC_4788, partial [Pristionchus entomophagus]
SHKMILDVSSPAATTPLPLPRELQLRQNSAFSDDAPGPIEVVKVDGTDPMFTVLRFTFKSPPADEECYF